MPIWPYRYQLSFKHRLRRSLYEVLRDQMDGYLVRRALVDSYWNFCRAGEPYPFVAKRELKPRARVKEPEYTLQNNFLVIFCEGGIPPTFKKYIRFFDTNKVSKETVGELSHIPMHKEYTKNLKYFDNPDFPKLVIDLSPVDYALLVQQDVSRRHQNRYMLSHFHVRIDWPIDDAAEDMAHHLRYISKDLYEQGEEYAQALHHKLFESYGFHHTVGGRRTAAVVAAQLLKQMHFISTIYVASSEARSLTRISERGVNKFVLVRLRLNDMETLARQNNLALDTFMEQYTIAMTDEYGVGILQVVYRSSAHSKGPEDGKLRKLDPEYQWLNVVDQLILPIPGMNSEAYPLPFNTIYARMDSEG